MSLCQIVRPNNPLDVKVKTLTLSRNGADNLVNSDVTSARTFTFPDTDQNSNILLDNTLPNNIPLAFSSWTRVFAFAAIGGATTNTILYTVPAGFRAIAHTMAYTNSNLGTTTLYATVTTSLLGPTATYRTTPSTTATVGNRVLVNNTGWYIYEPTEQIGLNTTGTSPISPIACNILLYPISIPMFCAKVIPSTTPQVLINPTSYNTRAAGNPAALLYNSPQLRYAQSSGVTLTPTITWTPAGEPTQTVLFFTVGTNTVQTVDLGAPILVNDSISITSNGNNPEQLLYVAVYAFPITA